MFTYICPKCGREVPPSYEDCPHCALEAGSQREAPQSGSVYPAAYPPPPSPVGEPSKASPQQQAPGSRAGTSVRERTGSPPQGPSQPFQSQGQTQPAARYVIAEPRRGMPSWLVALLVAGLLGGVLGALYLYFIPRASQSAGTATAPQSANAASEVVPHSAPSKPHPFARYLELTGFRLWEDAGQRIMISLLVVNHSTVPFEGLELNVELYSSKAAPGEPPVATFPLRVASVPANGFAEVQQRIETKLRVYELPDWQFLQARYEILKPQQ